MNTQAYSIRTYISRFVSGSLAALLLLFVPVPYVAADTAPANVETCNPVVAAPTGIQKPTGSDAPTYTYNECTGLWENPHYTWNPSTKVTTPKDQVVYTYNDTTEKWDASIWNYSASRSEWQLQNISVDQPPVGAKTVGALKPNVPVSTTSTGTGGSTVDQTTTNNSSISTTSNTTLSNNIDSTATTGSVTANRNTTVGSVLSGNSDVMANVINMINSTGLSTDIATFTANIDGDVQGDLIVDPSMLQPAGSSTINTANNVQINTENNGTINNTLNLTAQTGDVTANENTTAGNVQSGDAKAMANVVNMMNAYVSASQSFMGIININGNLNGNILMPENFLDTLLSSNAPHDTVSISQQALNNINTTIANNTNINNTINSDATSGSVSASGNTNVGNATSGSATTYVTVFNLTGSTVVAKNTMLVFVNVKGQWVGVLMNAPGSTSAAYGGGVSSNTTNNVDVNLANNASINNTINVAAHTGDATAARNTTVGNVGTGNASTVVNIANMTNTSLSNTGWFGLLFINVFGNWHGSFGVLPNTPTSNAGNNPASTQGQPPKTFDFVPGGLGSNVRTFRAAAFAAPQMTGSSTTPFTVAEAVGSVLGATTKPVKAVVAAKVPVSTHQFNAAAWLGMALVLAGALYFVSEYIRNRRSGHKS